MLSKSHEPVKPLRPKFSGQNQKSQSTHARDSKSSSQDGAVIHPFSFREVVKIEMALEFISAGLPEGNAKEEYRRIAAKVRKLPTTFMK